MSKSAANSKATAKPRGKPFPKGVSGNPAGAPKRGESWAEIIKRIGDMTPAEAADHASEIAKQLRKIGNSVTLKEAVVIRVYAALMFDPSASLLNSFMERAEGKVTDRVDITSKDEKIGSDDVRSDILRKLDSIAAATNAAGVSNQTDGE
jgi:hypothetical protein